MSLANIFVHSKIFAKLTSSLDECARMVKLQSTVDKHTHIVVLIQNLHQLLPIADVMLQFNQLQLFSSRPSHTQITCIDRLYLYCPPQVIKR